MAAIVYACLLFALLTAAALHQIGVRWRWAISVASIIAAGVGWSAADAIGLH